MLLLLALLAFPLLVLTFAYASSAGPARVPVANTDPVTDTDRFCTVDQLKAAYADGRLDLPEFEQRVHAALYARDQRDLGRVVAGL